MARIKPQALLQQSKKKKAPNRISVTTIILYGFIVVVMAFFLFATYRHWSRRSQIQAEEGSILEDSNVFADIKKSDISRYAILETSKGLITVELYKEGSPEVVDEFIDLCLKHEAFMLGTSKVKHDKEVFELFITTAPIPDLNEKLIVFGRVIKGEDVVQEIEEVDTDEHYRPKSPIGIINVTLKRKV